MPYKDPLLKYKHTEFAGSANMYINNYADVRKPLLKPLLHTVCNILIKAVTD